MELSNAQLKKILNIGVVICILFILIWEIFYNDKESFYKKNFDNILNENFSGNVIEKYYDKENHNSPTIVLNNSKISVVGNFWSEILVGDSIDKKKGEYTITVYKKVDTLILDYKTIIEEIKKDKKLKPYN
ncbi:hypothetical protein [Flavobacterium sp. 245]|uniref:hypothetical protein n=1 Tax=Flavobacterium sp. 245 TaxID=2512115 RepID=UPI0010600340|nr:hypothetical protein [Flavobacterium sp. 245]TDP03088.1 hypothetical protein EV145_102250 [Flavobacterium sp. 245]